jgi:hypothetical protein
VLTKENLPSIIERAVERCPEEVKGRNFCVISGAIDPDESFTKREHFIPEGLGYSWTALPAGVGTCDSINEAFAAHELEWLRYGSLGILRPYFVPKGKNGPPEFYAPKRSNHQVSFTIGKNGTFEIGVLNEGDPLLPVDGVDGPVDIEMNIPMSQANSTRVSLALNKMCLLSLWLKYPELVFDPAFDPVRKFLTEEPSQETFRPFHEERVFPGEPGVSIDFLVNMSERPSESGGKPTFAAIDTVFAFVRVHHMRYLLALAGDLPAFDDQRGVLRQWQPLKETVYGNNKVTFRVGRIGPLQEIAKQPTPT